MRSFGLARRGPVTLDPQRTPFMTRIIDANRCEPMVTQNAHTACLMTACRAGQRRYRPQTLWKTAEGCFAKIIFPENAKIKPIPLASQHFPHRKIGRKYPAFRENNPPCNPPVRPLQEAPQSREPAHERIA